ncbi:MAG TPA: peptidoglycan DD-metalloendopeptidase family protein [Candidatus Butyricicoccus avicola]|nr:peptidoglycan DD-metalloendopeptidase family protein [Candidatus Butyricicoccus avicola]
MYHKKRNRLIAAIIAGVLAVLMLGSTIFGALSMAMAASKSELNNRLAEIKSQKAEIEAQLAEYEKQKDNYAGQIGTLNNKINLTEQEIDATQEAIDALTDSIEETKANLKQAEKELADKQELFETRIRVMYENGDTSYMEVVLNSESFGDMLDNIEIVSQIMDYDKGVVAEYTAIRDSIQEMEESLEADRKQQKEYKESLEVEKEGLEADRADLQAMLAKIENDSEYAQKVSDQLADEQDEISNEIAELSRKEAEAAARKRAAASSSSSSSSSRGSSSSSSSSNYSSGGSGSLIWPCPTYTYISSEFGGRVSPITGKWQGGHKGMDIASGKGNPVIAAASGTVVKSYLSSSYGNYIVISHGGGLMTAYAHMTRRLVSVGDTVAAGQQIGTVGSTGNSTGNHLHFEVYENGTAVNPRNYVSP